MLRRGRCIVFVVVVVICFSLLCTAYLKYLILNYIVLILDNTFDTILMLYFNKKQY